MSLYFPCLDALKRIIAHFLTVFSEMPNKKAQTWKFKALCGHISVQQSLRGRPDQRIGQRNGINFCPCQ